MRKPSARKSAAKAGAIAAAKKAGATASAIQEANAPPGVEEAPRADAAEEPAATVLSRILGKWDAFTAQWNGYFVRYVDGDPGNSAPSNVACVSPRDAFARMDDWAVNWPQCLDPGEVQFVLDNREKFAAVFARVR